MRQRKIALDQGLVAAGYDATGGFWRYKAQYAKGPYTGPEGRAHYALSDDGENCILALDYRNDSLGVGYVYKVDPTNVTVPWQPLLGNTQMLSPSLVCSAYTTTYLGAMSDGGRAYISTDESRTLWRQENDPSSPLYRYGQPDYRVSVINYSQQPSPIVSQGPALELPHLEMEALSQFTFHGDQAQRKLQVLVSDPLIWVSGPLTRTLDRSYGGGLVVQPLNADLTPTVEWYEFDAPFDSALVLAEDANGVYVGGQFTRIRRQQGDWVACHGLARITSDFEIEPYGQTQMGTKIVGFVPVGDGHWAWGSVIDSTGVSSAAASVQSASQATLGNSTPAVFAGQLDTELVFQFEDDTHVVFNPTDNATRQLDWLPTTARLSQIESLPASGHYVFVGTGLRSGVDPSTTTALERQDWSRLTDGTGALITEGSVQGIYTRVMATTDGDGYLAFVDFVDDEGERKTGLWVFDENGTRREGALRARQRPMDDVVPSLAARLPDGRYLAFNSGYWAQGQYPRTYRVATPDLALLNINERAIPPEELMDKNRLFYSTPSLAGLSDLSISMVIPQADAPRLIPVKDGWCNVVVSGRLGEVYALVTTLDEVGRAVLTVSQSRNSGRRFDVIGTYPGIGLIRPEAVFFKGSVFFIGRTVDPVDGSTDTGVYRLRSNLTGDTVSVLRTLDYPIGSGSLCTDDNTLVVTGSVSALQPEMSASFHASSDGVNWTRAFAYQGNEFVSPVEAAVGRGRITLAGVTDTKVTLNTGAIGGPYPALSVPVYPDLPQWTTDASQLSLKVYDTQLLIGLGTVKAPEAQTNAYVGEGWLLDLPTGGYSHVLNNTQVAGGRFVEFGSTLLYVGGTGQTNAVVARSVNRGAAWQVSAITALLPRLAGESDYVISGITAPRTESYPSALPIPTPPALIAGGPESIFRVPSVKASVVDSQARIYLAGDFQGLYEGSTRRVGRLNPDGTLDATFQANVDGGAVTNLAVDSQGRVVIVGTFTTVDGISMSSLARLNPDGTLDGSFLSNEFAYGQTPGLVSMVTFDAQGRILVGGHFDTVNGQPCPAFARFEEDGTWDDTCILPIQAAPGDILTCTLISQLPDETILVSGIWYDENGRLPEGCFLRIEATAISSVNLPGVLFGQANAMAIVEGDWVLAGQFTDGRASEGFRDATYTTGMIRVAPDTGVQRTNWKRQYYPLASTPSLYPNTDSLCHITLLNPTTLVVMGYQGPGGITQLSGYLNHLALVDVTGQWTGALQIPYFVRRPEGVVVHTGGLVVYGDLLLQQGVYPRRSRVRRHGIARVSVQAV